MIHGYLSHPLWQCHYEQTQLVLQKFHCLFDTEEGIQYSA